MPGTPLSLCRAPGARRQSLRRKENGSEGRPLVTTGAIGVSRASDRVVVGEAMPGPTKGDVR